MLVLGRNTCLPWTHTAQIRFGIRGRIGILIIVGRAIDVWVPSPCVEKIFGSVGLKASATCQREAGAFPAGEVGVFAARIMFEMGVRGTAHARIVRELGMPGAAGAKSYTMGPAPAAMKSASTKGSGHTAAATAEMTTASAAMASSATAEMAAATTASATTTGMAAATTAAGTWRVGQGDGGKS